MNGRRVRLTSPPSVSRFSRLIWEPQRLTNLCTSTACDRDSFTFLFASMCIFICYPLGQSNLNYNFKLYGNFFFVLLPVSALSWSEKLCELCSWIIFGSKVGNMPITVAAWSKAWTVFARSNAGIVGSNPTQGIDVCVRLFCLCCSVCR
jgi:hypothetical protein